MAAVTVDTSVISAETFTGPITQSITIAANQGRVLEVAFHYADTAFRGAPSSVTYNGVAMTLVASREKNQSSTYNGVFVYHLGNPDTGTHNIVVNWTGTYISAYVQAVSLYNAYAGAPPHAEADGYSSGISNTLSGNTDGLILDFVGGTGIAGTTATVGGGQTQLQQTGYSTRLRVFSSRENAGAGINMTWTATNALIYASVCVAINPYSGRTLQAVSFGGGG